MRYFRSTENVYQVVCSQLDAAYGYPNAATKTLRSLPLASELPHDSQQRVYIAVDADYCNYILPSELLPQLLASGAIEEITQSQYQAMMPPSSPP
jgi:hypothetical protein